MLSFALVCLAKVCEYGVISNVMKDALLIVRVILQGWSAKDIKTEISTLQISKALGYY